MNKKLQKFWAARAARERKILMVGGLILLGVAAYFALVRPLTTRVPALRQSIPVLESHLFAMRAQPARATRGVGADADLRSTMFRLLAARQINTDVRSLTPERVELRLPAQGVTDGLSLVNSLRRESGAMVATMSIKGDGSGGPVEIVVEMERSQ